MPTATLTSKGQLTLPKKIREQLKVRAGDAVDFVIGDDGEVRVRAGTVDVSALRGLLHRARQRPISVERMNEVIRKAARRT